MGTTLYVPGMGETRDRNKAEAVFEAAKRREDEAIFVDLNWEQTIEDWIADLKRYYARCDSKNRRVVGMSLGAVTALAMTADTPKDLQPERLCLLSLSARFSEDLQNLPASHLAGFTVQQRQAFERLYCNVLAPKVECPTLLVIGEQEYRKLPTLAVRVHKAKELIRDSRLEVAPGAGHSLSDEGYKQIIAAEL